MYRRQRAKLPPIERRISKRKKCKKAKWLSEEALQIAEERREVKGKERIKGKIYLTNI